MLVLFANTEEGGFYGKAKSSRALYMEYLIFMLKYTILRFALYGERAKYDNGIRQILENIYKKIGDL